MTLQPSGRCCPTGQTWNGLVCALPCGNQGTPPCTTSCAFGPCNCLSAGSQCCNTGLISINGVCTVCGQNGQPTCAGVCSGGTVPSSGFCCSNIQAWNGSSCVTCGGLNQTPCTTGQPCQSGLSNNGSLCISCPTAGTEISRVCNNSVCNQAIVTYANGNCGSYTGQVTDNSCTAGCSGNSQCNDSYTFCGPCSAVDLTGFFGAICVTNCGYQSTESVFTFNGFTQSNCTGTTPPAGSTQIYCTVVKTLVC